MTEKCYKNTKADVYRERTMVRKSIDGSYSLKENLVRSIT